MPFVPSPTCSLTLPDLRSSGIGRLGSECEWGAICLQASLFFCVADLKDGFAVGEVPGGSREVEKAESGGGPTFVVSFPSCFCQSFRISSLRQKNAGNNYCYVLHG